MLLMYCDDRHTHIDASEKDIHAYTFTYVLLYIYTHTHPHQNMDIFIYVCVYSMYHHDSLAFSELFIVITFEMNCELFHIMGVFFIKSKKKRNI